MKTLEQLQAENAEAEVKATEGLPKADEVETEVEAVEEVTVEDDSPGEGDQPDADETETEAWMQTEDQASEGDDDDGSVVPLASLTKMRGKLKGRIGEQNEELEQLRAENAALKSGQPAAAQQPTQLGSRPKREDFDFDDDRYDAALDDWHDKRTDAKIASSHSGAAQTAAQTQAAKQLDQAVDDHYQRAAKLAEESGITPELYQNADTVVRQTIESVLPKMGDIVTDNMIARLGEGSEKVMYFLGRNKTAQEKLRSSLVTDPTGISAALYLGELKSTVAAPQKRVSRARPPATQIQSDEGGSAKGDAKKLKATYVSAHKAGRGQAAYNAKKQAKAEGIDVSDW